MPISLLGGVECSDVGRGMGDGTPAEIAAWIPASATRKGASRNRAADSGGTLRSIRSAT